MKKTGIPENRINDLLRAGADLNGLIDYETKWNEQKDRFTGKIVGCDWWNTEGAVCIFEKLCNDTCEVKQGLNVLEEEVMQEYKERICETK